MSKRKLTLANNPLFAGPSFKEREMTGVPYRELSPEVIDADPDQPRKEFDEARLEELAESIKRYGVLSPLLVRPGNIPGRFDLIAGERRLRASRKAGLQTVPVIIKESEEDGSDTLAVQLVENLQRSELSPFERAQAIAALRDGFKLSIRDIAERLGVSKSLVHRSLEVLELPPDLLDALKRGESESKVLLLARIADPKERAKHLRNLSIASREELERGIAAAAAVRRGRAGGYWEEDVRIAEEIQRNLGVKVSVKRNRGTGEQGKLIVEFYSNSDLQLVFQKLVS